MVLSYVVTWVMEIKEGRMPRRAFASVEEEVKWKLGVAVRLIRRKYRQRRIPGCRPACKHLLAQAKRIRDLARAGNYTRALHVANHVGNFKMMG